MTKLDKVMAIPETFGFFWPLNNRFNFFSGVLARFGCLFKNSSANPAKKKKLRYGYFQIFIEGTDYLRQNQPIVFLRVA